MSAEEALLRIEEVPRHDDVESLIAALREVLRQTDQVKHLPVAKRWVHADHVRLLVTEALGGAS